MKDFDTRVKETLEYIKQGKIGCTFAAVAAKRMLDGHSMGWGFYHYQHFYIQNNLLTHLNKDTISIIFPESWGASEVRNWLQKQPGFHEEIIKKGSWFRRVKRFLKGQSLIGVRYTQQLFEGKPITSWVTYSGPDAHCATRKTPYPMITLRIKIPMDAFHRVGYKNRILHVAQMGVYLFDVSKTKLELLWKSSHKNSEKIVGHKLNEEHAAKTTFKL